MGSFTTAAGRGKLTKALWRSDVESSTHLIGLGGMISLREQRSVSSMLWQYRTMRYSKAKIPYGYILTYR